MLSRELLRDLLRHMEWADARVWAAVPQNVSVDDRLNVLLNHIHTVQYAFLAIWRGDDVNEVFAAAGANARWSDVASWGRAYYPQAHAFLDSVSDERLAERIQMPWAAEIAKVLGCPPETTTVAETFFQVTSHSTYHRGQVNVRLRELNATPPLVDYIAWLWAGRPRPEWAS